MQSGRSCILNAYIYGGNTYLDNYLSVGDGTFKQVGTQNIATVSSFSAFGSMDANGDGLTDAFHAYNAAGIMTLELFLAQESGVFNPIVSKHSGMPTSYTFLGSMDINGDGKDDVIQLWSNSGYISFVSYISEGDGTFRTITTGTSISLGSYLNTLPMDINGDGRSDLLVVLSASSSIELIAFLSWGDGTFAAKVSAYPITTTSVSFSKMDINSDDKEDLVQLIHLADGRTGLETYISNGDGTFSIHIDAQSGPTSTYSYTYSGSAVRGEVSYGVIKKLKKDVPAVGIIEEWNTGNHYACYLSQGDGSYTYRNETHITVSSSGFLVSNLNGDGYSDLVKFFNMCSSKLYIYSYLALDVCSFSTVITSTFTLTNPSFCGTSTFNNRFITLESC